LLTQYFAGNKIEKNDIGGACGTYVGREKCEQDVVGETRGTEGTVETKT
jgi:hypothetical protein